MLRSRKSILFLWLWMALFALKAYPENTYYVDSRSGNDANSGLSSSSAWKTIGKINNSWSQIQTGDNILFKRGEIYADATLRIEKGGTSSNLLNVGAFGTGAKPVINCGPNALAGGIACGTANLSYVNIQDLAIKNVKTSGAQSIAFNADNLSHIYVSRVEIDGNIYGNGILFYKINTYYVGDCIIYNCGNCGIAIIGSPSYPITNGIIRNNIIHDIIGNDAITLHKDGDGYDIGANHQILNNVLYNCGEEGLDITSGHGVILQKNETFSNTNGGIQVGHGASSVWIDKHYSHDEKNVGIIIGSSFQVRLTSSIIYNSWYHQLTVGNCAGFECNNNTIVSGPDSTGSVLDISENSRNLVFYNNIIASIKTGSPSRLVRFLGVTPSSTDSSFSYNLYWVPNPPDERMWWDGTNLLTFNDWKLINGQDSQSQFAEPHFVDPIHENFHIREISPCVDAGIDLGLSSDFDGVTIPQGLRPDIGAFEYTAVLQASADAIPVSGQAPLAVGFTGSAIGGTSPYSYRWQFGDGQSSTSQNPTHTYTDAGSYVVILTVTDNQGLNDDASLSITVIIPDTGTFELSISSATGAPSPGQGGMTDPPPGNHTYSVGTTVQVKSLANENYRFSRWTGEAASGNLFKAIIGVFIDKTKSIVANFCTRCGDVTGDLVIGPADAQRTFDLYLGKIPDPTWCELENADVNSSGTAGEPKITPADAQAIFRKYLNKGQLPSDCSGASRTLEAATSFLPPPPGEVRLTWTELAVSQNGDLVFPVIIDSSSAIGAFGFDLLFPADSLTFIQVEDSDFSERFYQVGAHETAPGLIRVGGYASQPVPLNGPAVLVTLVFRATGSVPAQDSISIVNTCDDLRDAQIRSGIARQNTERKSPSTTGARRTNRGGKRYDLTR